MRELFVNVLFARRGYDKKSVKTAFHRVSNMPYADLIKRKEPKQQPETGTPFIYPYENDRDIHEHLEDASHFAVTQLQHEPLAVKLPQKAVFKVQANVKRFVMKASCFLSQRPKPGCFHCSDVNCRLHEVLEQTDSVTSFSKGDTYRIRGYINCDSSHVIYVWSCWKCGVQGVGECSSPKSRLLSYISAVEDIDRTGNTEDCALHRHFAEDHVLSDLSLCLVETLPQSLRQKPSMIPAFRKRLENVWIHRLDAKLNTQRFLHHSFSGDSAARSSRRAN